MPISNPMVSVIVPVYNAEQWLEAACKSLISQSYANWEAVLVVDGSPDDSITVARDMAGLDKRFLVIDRENGGIGAARNTGVDAASGDYIFFLDSDDELYPNALATLMAASRRSGAEITAGLGQDLFPDGRRKTYWTQRSEAFARHPTTYQLREMPSILDDHVVWAKLYDRSLFQRTGVRFPEGVHCEDIIFALTCQLAANKIAITNEPIYLHRRHGLAVSADYLRAKTLDDWIVQCGRTIDLVSSTGDELLTLHYALNHTMRQWLTRASTYHLIADRESLRGLELLAERLTLAGGSSTEELDPVARASLLSFTRGLPSGSWSSLKASPWGDINGTDPTLVVESALLAAERLNLANSDEAYICAVLLTWQVLAPIEGGRVSDADSYLARAQNAIESVPGPIWEEVELPASIVRQRARRSNERATHLLKSLTSKAAALTHVNDTATGRTISGTLPHGPTSWRRNDYRAVAIDADNHSTEIPVAVLDSRADRHWQATIPLPASAAAPVSWSLVQTSRYAPDLLLRLGDVDQLSKGLSRISSSKPSKREAEDKKTRRAFTFPRWYNENPYLVMLHTDAFASMWSFPGTSDPHALLHEISDRRAKGILHIHWTSPLTEKWPNEEEASRYVDRLIMKLIDARSRGRTVIWTVHNALPHDSQYPSVALRLHRRLAEVADLIHVLSPSTPMATEGQYHLPEEKVRLIEHSSYSGIYGSRLSSTEARASIGADPSSRTVLFFGQLRPYKGLHQLFNAAISLQESNPIELLLAGKPAPEMSSELERILSSDVRVASNLGFVSEADVATWFSAANVVVLPYRKVLNSGSMMLAATFGVPLVLPADELLLADYGDEAWIRFFDPSRAAESIAEILDGDWYLQSGTIEAAMRFARERSPVSMGRQYTELLREATTLAP